MLNVQRQVKPAGACYYGAAMVIAAIDAFATFLTGQRYYLAGHGFVVPERVEPDEVYDEPDTER